MSEKPKRTEENFKEDLKQFITNKILNTENFNSCFEGIPITETRLFRLKNRINEAVISAFLEDCSQIFVEAEIDKKFETFRSIKPTPNLTWRPPGDPVSQLSSVRAKVKRRQLEELGVLIKLKSERISKLKNQISPVLESVASFLTKQEEIEKVTASAQAVALNNKELLEDVYSDLAQGFELLYDYK